MKKELNCSNDYNEVLKSEIIAKSNSHRKDLADCNEIMHLSVIFSLAMLVLVPITALFLYSGMGMLILALALLGGISAFSAAASKKAQLTSTKCAKTERLAKIFRQERQERKEFCLNKLEQNYPDNASQNNIIAN